MSNSRKVLERAISQAKQLEITIEYKNIDAQFFDLKIFSSFGSGNRNYIFSHIPYTDIENMTEAALLEKIKQFSEHSIWK